jgi:hypothetical protein
VTGGFTFNGFVDRDVVCRDCHPGTPINLDLLAFGGDVRGTATLDGSSYTVPTEPMGPSNLDVQMLIQIEGEVIAPPPGVPGQTETVVAPVTFTGRFRHSTGMNVVIEALVANGAIATCTLLWIDDPPPFGPGWELEHVTYDIEGIPPIAIDIKPSTINAKSRGKISVAILSSETFDATTIDQQTLRFGKTGEEQSLAKCKKNAKDENHDGLPDLVCSFETDATGVEAGDTTAVLTGKTLDGTSFEGTDSIQVR